MDEEIKNAIGLLRHQIISPVLTDSCQSQWLYFTKMSERDWEWPKGGMKRFSACVMRSWLYRYRKHGFNGLVPKTRSDVGTFRKLSAETKEKIRRLRSDYLDLSCVQFYDVALKTSQLGEPPIGIETLRRFLKQEGLYKRRTPEARKRFEMLYFGEMWTADFMHGPHILCGKKRRRAILMCIIDDHSRMIVGFRWDWAENTKLIEHTFKEAILTYGLPDRFYCDNGAAFSSQYLALLCANLNVGLIHSKPYDSASRGKIERFFRTVRENFLTLQKNIQSLEALNDAFGIWIRDEYHQRFHHGILKKPVERYQNSISNYPRKRVDEEQLEEYFLVTLERHVNKDATISINSNIYEVPPQYIGQKVEIKFSQEKPSDIFLYDKGCRVTRIALVDAALNGKTYQPTPRISDVAFHELKTPTEET
jgi:putative transposase